MYLPAQLRCCMTGNDTLDLGNPTRTRKYPVVGSLPLHSTDLLHCLIQLGPSLYESPVIQIRGEYPRLPVSDACSDQSEPRSEQAGDEADMMGSNRPTIARPEFPAVTFK